MSVRLEHKIPIRGDLLAVLSLPHDLTQAEADRIKAIVDALVISRAPA